MSSASGAGSIGLVPTMGALHAGHVALFRAARAENATSSSSASSSTRRSSTTAADLAAYPRDEARDARLAADAGVDLLFAPSPDEIYPPGFQTWVDVERVSRGLEGDHRPGHFRGVATVCLKLFNIVRPQRAYFGQKDAQQVAVDPAARPRPRTSRSRSGRFRPCATPTASRSRRATRASRPRSARPRSRCHARSPRAMPRAHAAVLNGLDVDYVEVADFDPPVLAAAVRVGSTRLIDNVVLDPRHSGGSMTTRPVSLPPARLRPASSRCPSSRELKARRQPIAMVTAYDAPSGRLADAAGADLILVGDSAAMTVLGHDSTVPATMDEMLVLTRAVTRGARRPLVVADMPFGSFQVSDEEALRNAIRFVKEAGADAVKLEGAGPMLVARARARRRPASR